MKHLKKFKNISYNKSGDYNVGDYVIMKKDDFRQEQNDSLYNMFIITAIPTGSEIILYVDYYNKQFEKFNTLISINEVDRLATDDEIEDFDIKMKLNKYNI